MGWYPRILRGETRLDGALTGLQRGLTYYVNPNTGSNSRDGKSWDQAFLTMAKAFSVIASGDTIEFVGNVREQLTTPVQVFDVTIRATGNRPRHADTTPAGGQLGASTWKLPASGPSQTTPLLTILQQGWRLENILFAGPTTAACVQLFRDGGAGNAERDASHAEFINCRFASGRDGIEQSGGCGHVGIYGCFFTDLTGFAIKNTTGAGIGYPIRWVLEGNRFLDNANVLKMPCIGWLVRDNAFLSTTTEVFDTDAGDAAAGKNVVVGNYFNVAADDFDPAGNVEGNATDVWSNTLKDAVETGVPAN
jgi:hypothetical protein